MPNSFVGVDVANFSGGVFDAQNLLQGNNLACFGFSAAQQGIPDFLNKPLSALGPVTNLIAQYFNPVFGDLACSQLGKYDYSVFNQFPGRSYHPTGPATNYKV